MQMNFYSLFGPNIYSSNHETTDEVAPPSSRDILSNIFSTEIQDLLAQVLNQPTSTSQESQTEPAATTEATGEDDLIYFEPAASNGISLSDLNTVSTLSVKTADTVSTDNSIHADTCFMFRALTSGCKIILPVLCAEYKSVTLKMKVMDVFDEAVRLRYRFIPFDIVDLKKTIERI